MLHLGQQNLPPGCSRNRACARVCPWWSRDLQIPEGDSLAVVTRMWACPTKRLHACVSREEGHQDGRLRFQSITWRNIFVGLQASTSSVFVVGSSQVHENDRKWFLYDIHPGPVLGYSGCCTVRCSALSEECGKIINSKLPRKFRWKFVSSIACLTW